MPRNYSSPSMPEKKTAPLFIDSKKDRYSSPSMPEKKKDTKPSLLDSIKDGVGLGIGSSLGHRLVESIFGYTTPRSINDNDEKLCKSKMGSDSSKSFNEFDKCMKEYDDKKLCEKFI
jgi:hypothetical protein